MALNLAVLLNESVARHAQRTALIYGDARMTYAELNVASNKVANALRSLGIRRGDKVAVMLPNVPQFPIVYYGILKLGATVVPIDTLLRSSNIHAHVTDAGASALFVWEDYIDEARQGVASVASCRHLIIVNNPGSDTLPHGAISLNAMMAIGSSSFETVWTMADDTAAIIYAPRPDGLLYGAELTHLNLFFNACTLADRQLGLGSQDVALAAVPLFDVRGQTCVMNATLYAGGAVVLVRDVAAAPALQVITKQRVTYLVGDAPLYGALSQQAQSAQPGPSSLATCLSFGQPLPADVALALRERLGVSVLEGYGLAEASPVVTLNPRQAQRPGSVGLPMWGTEVRVRDADGRFVGPGETAEIVVRGHNVMKGYHNRPAESAHALGNDWLHTGDHARYDDDGYLYLVDRQDRLSQTAAAATAS